VVVVIVSRGSRRVRFRVGSLLASILLLTVVFLRRSVRVELKLAVGFQVAWIATVETEVIVLSILAFSNRKLRVLTVILVA